MPLYSSETLTNAIEGENDNRQESKKCLEVEMCPDASDKDWHYLFIHHTKVGKTEELLRKRFNTFVHKTIIYKRENKRIRQQEYATISGLVFVQGDSNEIQSYLSDNFSSLYLVKNCATKRVATIPDAVMRPFMQLIQISPTRIRFMPNTFGHYSAGNTLIRITSGILTGFEGYRIRIARDKCLVTSVGGMTVAIGGIYKESFENLDEYVRQRRAQLHNVRKPMPDMPLSPIQSRIDECFYEPHNRLDIMALSKSADCWTVRAEKELAAKNFDEAAEIALFVLEEAGGCFLRVCERFDSKEMDDILTVCRRTDCVLTRILHSVDVSVDLKEIIESGRESLMIRFPFLPIEMQAGA
ncbi:MAG: transcriptional regulator [Bacteroides sp.]|nr:hypothetical protein [Roseburia sp.]MCM1346021.1 transcriptional regulator [Bacteroides sp.]MCM1421487.1 transcriptional regulator [Bacteroides sp.]